MPELRGRLGQNEWRVRRLLRGFGANESGAQGNSRGADFLGGSGSDCAGSDVSISVGASCIADAATEHDGGSEDRFVAIFAGGSG
jgi:hypothetical protein